MSDIFGYSWEDIKRAQNGGKLNKTVDMSKPGKPAPKPEDYDLLEKYGSIEALKAAGLHGVADRLEE